MRPARCPSARSPRSCTRRTARVAAALAASLDPLGDGILHEECRVICAGGEVRWVLMQGSTELAGEGPDRRPLRVAGTILDVTDRRAYEENLRQARARAEAASEAKSQFLANMSHEIRTPLTAILGFADVLSLRLKDPEEQSCVDTIKRNGAHLRQILDDFLDLAKIESGRLTPALAPCDPLAVVAEICSLFQPRAREKGLSLTAEPRWPLPSQVRSDPKLLRQILLNLVGNAIKFTERGGVRIGVQCRVEDQRLVLEVTDSGIGIGPDGLDVVFEPFEQLGTHGAGGTGLGLAITRRLVVALGGEIAVDSEPGQGTTFFVRLPTGPLAGADRLDARAWPDCTEAASPAPEEAPAFRGRVLAIDDQRDVRRLVRELVQGAGGKVITAAGGKEGIAAWRRERGRGRALDLILLDLRMPDMDGLETARRLRASGCRAPILALTANAMPRERDACLAAGCDGMISKPIDRVGLLSALAHWAGRERAEHDAGPKALHILCVDDDPDTCTTLKMLLEHHGHRVSTAGSGAAALAAAAGAPLDVALIDVGLGDMSGLDLVPQLRQCPAAAGALLVCVSGHDADAVRWREAGFHRFLRKPVALAELLELLAGLSTKARD